MNTFKSNLFATIFGATATAVTLLAFTPYDYEGAESTLRDLNERNHEQCLEISNLGLNYLRDATGKFRFIYSELNDSGMGDKISEIQQDLGEAEAMYDDLVDRYKNLYNEYKTSTEGINSDAEQVKSEYDSLSNKYNDLVEEYNKLKNFTDVSIEAYTYSSDRIDSAIEDSKGMTEEMVWGTNYSAEAEYKIIELQESFSEHPEHPGMYSPEYYGYSNTEEELNNISDEDFNESLGLE